MTTDWLLYSPYQPLYPGLLRDLTRAQARESFGSWMISRSERWRELRALAAQEEVEFDESDAGIQRLDDWFRRGVEVNPSDPERLANRWYAVCNDIGIVLGDVLISRCPHLQWKLFTAGKRDIAFHKPVVMGFAGVANSSYNFDPSRIVATYGQRIISGNNVDRSRFVQAVQGASAHAVG